MISPYCPDPLFVLDRPIETGYPSSKMIEVFYFMPDDRSCQHKEE
jgi:hypothetical protein